MFRKTLRMLAALALCLSLTGCFMLPQEEEALAPHLREVEPLSYNTVTVGKGDLELVEQVSASFVPTVQYNLSFPISGRVSAVHVYAGQTVKKGDVLMELDNSDIQKRIRDQQIALEKLQLQLAQQEQSESDALQEAELNLREAQNHMNDLRDQLSKIALTDTGLPVSGSDQEEQYQELERQIRDQQIILERAQLRYDQASKQETGYARQSLELDLQAAQNTLNDLQEQYEATLLYAPQDGKIRTLLVDEVGGNISAYSTMIVFSDPKQLVLQYTGTKAANFPVGVDVTITIDREDYHGVVLNNPDTLPRNDDGSKQNAVQFELKDYAMSDAQEGATGVVRAVLDSRQDVIVLDKALVTTFLSRKYVRLYVDGLSVERDVKIGLETSTKVEILEGLEVGDKVIAN